MAKPKVLIKFNTDIDTVNHDIGRAFMEILCDTDKRLIPEQVSMSDNYKDPFVNIDSFVDKWWAMKAVTTGEGESLFESYWGPSWRRRRVVKSEGMVEHGFVNKKNWKIESTIDFEANWHKQVDFNGLFDKWTHLFKPEMAMLHVFTDIENQPVAYNDPRFTFRSGIITFTEKIGLPNMGWAMVFGHDNAKEVDVARIRNAGYQVDEYEHGVMVRVTDRLSDVIDDFAHFSKRRHELKSLFRPNLFVIKEEPDVNTV